jgi:hypothetical protein
VAVAVSPNATLELLEGTIAWFTYTGAREGLLSWANTCNAAISPVRPQAIYDAAARRFVLAAADTASDSVWLAVSASPYVGSPFSCQRLPMGGGELPGAPSLGATLDAIAVAVSALDPATHNAVGSELWMINASSVGSTPGWTNVSVGPAGVPADLRAVPQVRATLSAFFVGEPVLGTLTVMRVTGAPPAPLAFSWDNTTVPVYAAPRPLPQPGSSDKLMAPPEGVASSILQGGLLATVGTVSVGGLDELQLVQLNVSSGVVRQQLLITNGASLAYPSVTTDSTGDLGIVAESASALGYVSVVTVGQPYNEPGALSAFGELAGGSGSIDGNCNATLDCLWGNSTAAAPDPLDPVEGWIAGTYVDSSGATYTTSIGLIEYPPLSASVVLADRPGIDVGQHVNFTVFATGGTGALSYNWSGGLPAGCAGANASSVDCAPTGAGTTEVSVAVRDGGGVTERSAELEFITSPSLAVPAPRANRSGADIYQAIEFSATPTGGAAPYFYQWSVPEYANCSDPTVATISCVFLLSGRAGLSVSVDDGNLMALSNNTTFTVEPLPHLGALAASTNPVEVGSVTNLSTTVSGGSGVFSFLWKGLPSSCPSQNASQISCTPSKAGRYVIEVLVFDSNGGEATSSVILSVTGQPSTGPGPSTPSWLPGAVAAGLIGIAGIGAVAYLWRRREQARRPFHRPPPTFPPRSP